jgi:hypothetical protein
LTYSENFLRTSRGVTTGNHYFEIMVEIPVDSVEEERYDRGTEISLSLGKKISGNMKFT